MTYGSGGREDENSAPCGPETSEETLYPTADKTPVPGLSRLKVDLARAVAAGDWLRVAELAAQLAYLLR